MSTSIERSEITDAELHEEAGDIKPGRNLRRLVWHIINAVFPDKEDEKSLSFNEKKLLDDVLRFGSLKDVAKAEKIPPATAADRFKKVLEKLDERVDDLISGKQELTAMRVKMESYESDLAARDASLRKMEEKLEESESLNDRLLKQLKESSEIIRLISVSKANRNNISPATPSRIKRY